MLKKLRPPISKRTDTLFTSTSLFRSPAEVRQRRRRLRCLGCRRRQTGVPAQGVKRPAMSAGLRVFLFFSLGYLVSYLFRGVNIGFGPYLTQELNLSAADLGILTSLYFLGFALMQLPAGLFLDTWGPRRVNALMLLLDVAGTPGYGLSDSMDGPMVDRKRT